MSTSSSPALRQIGAAARVFLTLTVVLGVIYPLTITGVAQVAFDENANGSIVRQDGQPVGSALIGQAFFDAQGDPLPQYFQPRPSASDYDALATGASNLGPNNPELVALVEQRRAAVVELNGTPPHEVAPGALLASGSAVDPHISPLHAHQQVSRVARERGLDPQEVQRLVDEHTSGRALGILGEPHVNVLRLNLALDHLSDPSGATSTP